MDHIFLSHSLSTSRTHKLITEANFKFFPSWLCDVIIVTTANDQSRPRVPEKRTKQHKILSFVIAFNYSNLLSGKSLQNLNNLRKEISIISLRFHSFPASKLFFLSFHSSAWELFYRANQKKNEKRKKFKSNLKNWRCFFVLGRENEKLGNVSKGQLRWLIYEKYLQDKNIYWNIWIVELIAGGKL